MVVFYRRYIVQGSSQSPDEELYRGDVNPRLGARNRRLEILRQAAVAIEPSQGPFDDPAPRQQLKADSVSGAFDDLDGPLAEFGESFGQVGAVVDTVGEEMAQPGKQLVDGLNNQHGTIAVLDIGGVHLGTNQQTRSIGHNMTLAAFDLLCRIVNTRPAALGRLYPFTFDDPRRWAGFTTRRLARLQQQLEIDLLKQAIVSPIVEIALHRRERGKVLGQHPPLAAGPRDIQDRVKHGSQLNLTRPAQRLGRRHMRLDQPPFSIGQIACVAPSLSLILASSSFGPHLVPR